MATDVRHTDGDTAKQTHKQAYDEDKTHACSVGGYWTVAGVHEKHTSSHEFLRSFQPLSMQQLKWKAWQGTWDWAHPWSSPMPKYGKYGKYRKLRKIRKIIVFRIFCIISIFRIIRIFRVILIFRSFPIFCVFCIFRVFRVFCIFRIFRIYCIMCIIRIFRIKFPYFQD